LHATGFLCQQAGRLILFQHCREKRRNAYSQQTKTKKHREPTGWVVRWDWDPVPCRSQGKARLCLEPLHPPSKKIKRPLRGEPKLTWTGEDKFTGRREKRAREFLLCSSTLLPTQLPESKGAPSWRRGRERHGWAEVDLCCCREERGRLRRQGGKTLPQFMYIVVSLS
jgi:hypothetical protein